MWQFLFNLLFRVWNNIGEILWFSRNSLTNRLSIFVKTSQGSTVSVELDPKWDIKEVKEAVAPKLGFPAEEMEFILAGKILDDSIVIEECDLGEQSILHAVHRSGGNVEPTKSRPLNQTLVTLTEEETPSEEKAHFYVFCSTCGPSEDSKDGQPRVRTGKLRVRCSSCKSGAITVDKDPAAWEEVLVPKSISGHCQQDNCQDGPVAWAEFYFKCAEHAPKPGSGLNEAVSLYLVRRNTKNVPCLACTDILDVVLVFPCTHTTCLSCFRLYATSRLRERRFSLDPEHGYTLSCPVGCTGTSIAEIHHFRIMAPELYATYQRFATEECILQNGGVLCPYPNCGMGVYPDPSCTTVRCSSCSFVFCKKCLQGNHLGECDAVEETPVRRTTDYPIDPNKASQARWDEASRVTIKTATKPCPKCRTATERDGGCMHMVCTRCDLEWCWVCQIEWTRDCMGSHWFG